MDDGQDEAEDGQGRPTQRRPESRARRRRRLSRLPEHAIRILGRVRRSVHERLLLARARVLVQRTDGDHLRFVERPGQPPVGPTHHSTADASDRYRFVRRRLGVHLVRAVASAVAAVNAPRARHFQIGQVTVGRVVHLTLCGLQLFFHLFVVRLGGQSVHPQQAAVAFEHVTCGTQEKQNAFSIILYDNIN